MTDYGGAIRTLGVRMRLPTDVGIFLLRGPIGLSRDGKLNSAPEVRVGRCWPLPTCGASDARSAAAG